MVTTIETLLPASAAGSDDSLARSFRRSLLAENKSEHTIGTYMATVAQFGDFLRAKGMPTNVEHIRREHVEDFLIDLQGRLGRRPSTVATRHRTPAIFFKWLTTEGELKASPTANIKSPKVPEEPPPGADRRPAAPTAEGV